MAAPRSFSCKAILFDLDGVLVDSAECVERTWRKWATRHRLDPESVIERLTDLSVVLDRDQLRIDILATAAQ